MQSGISCQSGLNSYMSALNNSEAEESGEGGKAGNMKQLAAHSSIIWARCPNLRLHVDKAWTGQVTKGYDCHVVFLRKTITSIFLHQDDKSSDENDDNNRIDDRRCQCHLCARAHVRTRGRCT